MEILATIEQVAEFWFEFILILLVVTLYAGMTIGRIYYFCKKRKKADLVVAILFLAMTATASLITVNRYEEGIETEYKVLITDYNEVHDKGYEIIEQEGEIFTIKKKDE